VIPRITLPTLVVGGRVSVVPWKSQVWIQKQVQGSRIETFEENERQSLHVHGEPGQVQSDRPGLHRLSSRMSISGRLVLGFVAGFLSHLIFQGAFWSALYAANLLPGLPWSLAPVPPLGVPRSLSLGFWAWLWGVVYVLLEGQLTALLGWVGRRARLPEKEAGRHHRR
jgi:hypothetical protein